MRVARWLGALLLLAATASAAAVPAPESVPDRMMSPLGQLPASFEGEMPDAGGPVRWQLDLMPAGRFQLRRSAAGRPLPDGADAIGRYTLEGDRLTLRGTGESPLVFALQPDASLRRLDAAGRPIESPHPHTLQRLAPAAPIAPQLVLTGSFTLQADVPRIELCADGQQLPVQPAADYSALLRAYLQAVPRPGEPVRVQLEGLIALSPAADESQPPRPTLLVQRFDRVLPGAGCDAAATARGEPATATAAGERPFARTDWRLVWLAGRSVAPQDTPRPVTLQFDAAGGRLTGSDGCNRLSGPYRLDGAGLTIGAPMGTRIGCATGQEIAARFGEMLAQVRRYAIRDGLLELQDAAGAPLARLEATR